MPRKTSNIYTDIFSDDKLNIKKYVIDFAHLIEQETANINHNAKVYSISAEFGGGKSFFCEKLHKVLQTDSVPVATLNIWEMDFYENPLMPLLIKINDIYDIYNPYKKNKQRFNKICNAIKALFLTKFFDGIKLNTDRLVRIYNKLNNSTNIYDNYKKYEQELSVLKTALTDWIKKLNKPAVIIIDELDRCRPDFAVSTLEILKHFFDIPGFVFILALDEGQLQSSVKRLFGTENFDGYKRKFINNSFILPDPDKQDFTKYLYEKSGIQNIINNIHNQKREILFQSDENELLTSADVIQNYFSAYSIWFKFSLRQMEQVFDRLYLFTKQFNAGKMLYSPDLAVLLVCLHEFDIKIYKCLQNTADSQKMSQGVLKYIYDASDTSSVAFKLYGTNAPQKFDKLDRGIIPLVPNIDGFSGQKNISYLGNTKINRIIYDNADRFFNNNFNNDGIIHTETINHIDIRKIRQSYFDKINFISHFDSNFFYYFVFAHTREYQDALKNISK